MARGALTKRPPLGMTSTCYVFAGSRSRLRVQSALESLRGPTSTLFLRGGTATDSKKFVPDQEIRFSVTPRNMTLGR